jgi:Raf kinase inhibitor-like YbhB/YbcL family protein
MTKHGTPEHPGSTLTIARVAAYEHRGIALASPVLDINGRIEDRYSAWHDNEAPSLGWSNVIEAQSYALVVEDPDAPTTTPFVHWLIWNIPGTAIEIPMNLPRVPRPSELPGAIQGRNSAGTLGWHGPKPPVGPGVHHYHFQLFALSATVGHLGPDTPLEKLVSVLKGLTIASGELVGTYERLDPISDAPSLGRTGGYGSNPHADTAREHTSGRGGLDADDLDRHAPHEPEGEVQRP